jgi:hypothetical protein
MSVYICPYCLEECGMCGHRECWSAEGAVEQDEDKIQEALARLQDNYQNSYGLGYE